MYLEVPPAPVYKGCQGEGWPAKHMEAQEESYSYRE